ncbi:MAG: FkbM family methyltransferase [Prevotellaceae bacterium]|jgi:FkbM family methyltransferase|nr:FkbM family methyltransferase [Prevotellaceae bacterium]
MKATKKEFRDGQVSKQEYLEKMYEVHAHLFDYSELMKDTNVSKIVIEDDTVVVTCRNSGVKLICAKGDVRSVPLTIFNLDDYEADELNMQLQLIKDGDTVFDIGGNIGWYALHVAQKYPSSTVCSFEPLPPTFEQLRSNIRINGAQNITANNIGFSDSAGEVEFFIDPAISGNASMVNVAEKEHVQVFRCRVETLDSYVSSTSAKVDFIKCDVEGAELFVFRGGINTLKNQQPIVFTEMLRKWSAKFSYHPNDIIEFFKPLGYTAFTILPPPILTQLNTNLKLRKFDLVDEDTVETNYFFLHHEKHAGIISRFVEPS